MPVVFAVVFEPDGEDESESWSSELLSEDEDEAEGWFAVAAAPFEACGCAPCEADPADAAFAGLAALAELPDGGVACGLDARGVAAPLAGADPMRVCSTSEKLCDGAVAGAELAAGAEWGPDIISRIARAMKRAACA